MSTKTSFKRLALGVVVAMGLGLMSTAPSVATVSGETLVLSGTGATTNTAVVNESATAVTATLQFFASAANDSRSIIATAVGSGTAAGGSATIRFRATSDSLNVTYSSTGIRNAADDRTAAADTVTVVTANSLVKATYSVQAYGFSAAGTYTITVAARGASSTDPTNYETRVFATYTVTVSAASTEPTSIRTYTTEFSAGGLKTAEDEKRKLAFASYDSAVVVSTGTAGTYTGVAYVFANLFASNNETRTGTARTNICNTPCEVNVTIDRGAIDNARGNSPTVSETISVTNSATLTTGESLVVYSAGNTAGVATLTYRLAANGALLGTSTVTFAGNPASVSQMYSNDTITYVGASTGTLNAVVRDSGNTILKSGTVYLYSSDTKVAGSTSASAAAQACTIGSTGVAACSFTVSDTGTATLTLRDSTTVALSTWVSSGWEVTVTGVVPKSDLTVAFDKASYLPGERAVITITANDSAGRKIATVPGGIASLFTVTSNKLTSSSYVTSASIAGTQGASVTETSFLGYMDSGVETRVVTMPTFAGDVTYSLRYVAFGQAAGNNTTATATTTVVDPNAAAIAAAGAAADAATDAANEAIDAANAATDAANIAAEAADAATVAAEEARDAADAATAAVEELATQVATLMAALSAQVKTLANTVAKIAKKVKA